MGPFTRVRVIGMTDTTGVNCAAVALQAYRLGVIFRVQRRIDCVLTTVAGLAEYPMMTTGKAVQPICRFAVGRIMTLTTPGLINPGPAAAACQIFEVAMTIAAGLSFLKHDAP